MLALLHQDACRFGLKHRAFSSIITEGRNIVEQYRELFLEHSANDILCFIRAGDWLCDLDTLALLNEAYEDPAVDIVASNFRIDFSLREQSANLELPFAGSNHDYQHFKTFRTRALQRTLDIDAPSHFEYHRHAPDDLLFSSVLLRARKVVRIPICAYHRLS